MGATQSNSTFVDIKEGTTKIKQYFDDGTFEFIEIDCLIITTSGGIEITILDQDFNYAVKLGKIPTIEANNFLSKKGCPILTNGKKKGLFEVFGHHGEFPIGECFGFFPANSVKTFL